MKLNLSSINQCSSRNCWSQLDLRGDSASVPCPSLPLIPLGAAPGWWSLLTGEATWVLPWEGSSPRGAALQSRALLNAAVCAKHVSSDTGGR